VRIPRTLSMYLSENWCNKIQLEIGSERRGEIQLEIGSERRGEIQLEIGSERRGVCVGIGFPAYLLVLGKISGSCILDLWLQQDK